MSNTLFTNIVRQKPDPFRCSVARASEVGSSSQSLASILLLMMAALPGSSQTAAQKAPLPPANEGLACFENLVAPEYPANALEAHVDGSVWTWTEANPQGTPEKIDTQVVSAWSDGSKLLTPPVEKAIRSAKIKPACAGKKISVVFRYQLHGEATANPKVTSRTDAPNIMYIESQPASPASTLSRTNKK